MLKPKPFTGQSLRNLDAFALGAMRYVDGIPDLRKHKSVAVSTAAESAAVPVLAAIKATSVTVKAFS